MSADDFKDAVDLLMYATKVHGELYKVSGSSPYKAILTSPEMIEFALRLANALAAERRAS